MRTGLKIIAGFAAVGFTLPLLLLAFYDLSGTTAGELFVWVCPASILSMGLDNSSWITAVIVWLIICASNAVLYAMAGSAVAFLFNLRNLGKPST